MLIYEHSRTESIVNRLVALANIFRILSILGCVLFWVAALGALAQYLSEGAWYIGAIAGFIVGYLLGLYTSALLVVSLEWMGQMLVAQGEIVKRMKDQEYRMK